MQRILSFVFAGGALCAGLLGCGQGGSGGAAPAGSAGSAAGATSAVVLAYPELAQAPVEKGTRRTESVRSAGVVVGLPAGWKTADATGGSEYNESNASAMGNCLFITHPNRNNTTTSAVRMDALPATKGKGIGAKTLERYAFIARFDGAEWEAWKSGVVGAKRYAANLAHARSGAREGIAAWVEVPGKKPILVIGSWGDAEEKAAVFDILRGIDAGT